MRIGFLVGYFPKLSETFILNQVVGLLDRGHDVCIYAGYEPDESVEHGLVEEYQLLDRTVYTQMPQTASAALSRTATLLVRQPRSLPEVVTSLRRGREGVGRIANMDTVLRDDPARFDVHHAHFGLVGQQWDFLAEGSLFAPRNDVPFVTSFYGYDASSALREDPDTYRDLFERCDRITVLSSDMKRKLRTAGCPPEKLAIVPLAIDTSLFEFRPRTKQADGRIELFTAARFVEKKGLEYAIRAVSRLAESHPVRYRIAGDGPRRDRLERLIRREGLDTTVELLGWQEQNEIRRLYHDSHVFLLPSVTASNGDQEGTPTVLLEAQATGMPIVATQHAGIPEIVEDGGSGTLVPERDVDALAEALDRMAASAETWPEMGAAGRELVERRHSIPAMVDRLETLYRSLGA